MIALAQADRDRPVGALRRAHTEVFDPDGTP
jgi:hypothetical protein